MSSIDYSKLMKRRNVNFNMNKENSIIKNIANKHIFNSEVIAKKI